MAVAGHPDRGRANEIDMASAARPFVGRQRELEEIAGGLGEASSGRGALFVIVGAAGIGKTRLADECVRAAEARGFRAVWGRCWETGGAPAYWPWMQILRELGRGEAGARALAAIGEPSARLLAPLVAGPSDVAASPDSDPTQARFRLFDAAVALLRVAAEQAPLALVLDDLHAADPSSLALLHFLARNLRGLNALVLGTYRDEEARQSPEIGRTLAEVAREGAYLPIGPLGRGEVATLVDGAVGGAADTALVDEIQRASEGNPLFLSELLRLLATRGDLAGRHGGAPLPIPETVKGVIDRRLARLAAPTRDALALAAVVGRDFATAVAAAVTGLAAATLAPHLADAERAGLLLPVGERAWRFSHVLVREVLYDGLGADRRAETHLRLAGALESGPHPDEARAEIAHHRLRALPTGDVGLAVAAARTAAAAAAAMLAFEDAAALLERTREALAALSPSHAVDERVSCELTLLASLAWMRGGRVERGQRGCLEVAAQARRLGAGDLLARAALGYGAELILAISDRQLIALLEEALGMLPPGPGGLRAQCLARLAAAQQPAPHPQGPIVIAREAVAMARALADAEVLRPVLAAAGSAMADYAPPAERWAVSEELARLATAAGDRALVLRAQARLVIDGLETGALARSNRALDAYEALAREFRQTRHLWPGRYMRAMLASATGRFDEAERVAAEVRAMAIDEPLARFTHVLHRAVHAARSERAAELAAAERAVPSLFEIPNLEPYADDTANFLLALFRSKSGDQEAARRHLAAIPGESGIHHHEYGLMVLTAEIIAAIGDRDLAARAFERLAPVDDRIASLGRVGMACAGPVSGARALLAAVLGRRAEAAAGFEAALAATAAAGLRPARAQLAYWAARFHADEPTAQGRARGATLAAEARGLADELALPLLKARLDRLDPAGERDGAAAPVRSAPAAPATPAAPGPRFTIMREGDFWTVSAGGQVSRLKDGRGIQMLAQLCAAPGRELHVLALMGAVGDHPADGGDAGALLDEEAIADYRARLAELDEELAEAEGWADGGRVGRLQAEREALAAELARGVGLGGRERRAGGATERARTNVQRRLRGAIRKIGETLPALGTYLDRAVKTGTFCSYEPF